jgi:glyoxylase-like metal-dependent hydrolase (beta-lactamase superfamily II)
MRRKPLALFACLALLAAAAWFGKAGPSDKPAAETWSEVTPGVWQSSQSPAGHALVEGDTALLIDAPHGADGLKAHGVKKIDAVLLTHHHRDTCAAVSLFLTAAVPVRAPKASAEWLTPTGVSKYWRESIPLRNSRTSYLVVPTGIDGLEYSLEDGQMIDWHGWSLRVVATPGHARDHVAFAARKGKTGKLVLFCGDALYAAGKLWTPYTTDWDHWTDAGLTPTAASLRKLASFGPDVLLPAHGPMIATSGVDALNQTAAAVENLAFLKSFERFTKQQLGNAPTYRFLAPDQVASSGEKPWSQISEHLFLTGNTYVLVSKDNAFLVVDPWGKRSADQVAKLVADRKLGPLEVVMFSHAHFDHYDGIYELPNRDQFQVWTLDRVAPPIADPALLRAPFLDARPVRIDRRLRDGDTANWREYSFRFHHLPGQTEFTMGVETTLDGKRCYFTADNFFHQDQFTGTGGWMGLNRSYPLLYAESAQKVLAAAPDWVLAEHGGPFDFNAEDFRRRVQWGQVSAKAADAVCPSGNHRQDWDINRVAVRPLLQTVRRGATVQATLVAANALNHRQSLAFILEGRELTAEQRLTLDVPAGQTRELPFAFRLDDGVKLGRQVLILRGDYAGEADGSDALLVLDVEP